MSSQTDQPLDRVELRDGILLIVLGLAVGAWLIRTGTTAASSVGFVIAGWGLLLVANALWIRSRRRT